MFEQDLLTPIVKLRARSVYSPTPIPPQFKQLLNEQGIHIGSYNNMVSLYFKTDNTIIGNLKPKYILTEDVLTHPDYELSKLDFFNKDYKLYQYKGLKRVLFMLTSEEKLAGTYFRVMLPCYYLQQNYRDVFATAVPCWNDVFTESDIEHADLLVYFLWHKNMLESMKYAKTKGKKVVYDTDDNTANITPVSMWYDEIAQKQTAEALKEAIGIADLVSVTTNELKKELLLFNKNVSVLPNKLDLNLPAWNLRKENLNRNVVMWAGSLSHRNDLLEYSGAITRAVKETNSLFMLCGYRESFEMKIADKDGKLLTAPTKVHNKDWDNVLNAFSSLGKENFGVIEVLPIEQYPSIYSQASICVAPLKDTKINRSRSNLKALEAWGYSLPIVVSDLPPYANCVNEVDCLKADSPSKFYRQLKRLIKDTKLQEGLGLCGRQRLEKQFNASNQDDRYKCYMDLIKEQNEI